MELRWLAIIASTAQGSDILQPGRKTFLTVQMHDLE